MLITILEDDSTLQYALSKYLRDANYEIRVFNNLKDALSHEILDGIYLVDVNLQDGLGFEYGKKISKNKNAYLIYLTVRKEQSDILKGFNTGADDYITKSFSFEELEQRINALLRRNTERYLKLGNLLVDTDLAIVTINNEEIFLSVQEYRILYLLLRQEGNPVSRESLNSSLNIMDETQEGTLNVAITRLRKKLGDKIKIEAVYKQGYRISV